MMEPTSYSADTALAEALARLQAVEQDNTVLRSRLNQLSQDASTVSRAEKGGWGSGGGGGGGEGKTEVERLHKQMKEVSFLSLWGGLTSFAWSDFRDSYRIFCWGWGVELQVACMYFVCVYKIFLGRVNFFLGGGGV